MFNVTEVQAENGQDLCSILDLLGSLPQSFSWLWVWVALAVATVTKPCFAAIATTGQRVPIWNAHRQGKLAASVPSWD